MYLRGRQTPIHFSLFHRGVLCQEGSQIQRRDLFKVETKHQVLLGTNLLHNNMLELIQSVQSASKETLAGQLVLLCVIDIIVICLIYFVNSDLQTLCLIVEKRCVQERSSILCPDYIQSTVGMGLRYVCQHTVQWCNKYSDPLFR